MKKIIIGLSILFICQTAHAGMTLKDGRNIKDIIIHLDTEQVLINMEKEYFLEGTSKLKKVI